MTFYRISILAAAGLTLAACDSQLHREEAQTKAQEQHSTPQPSATQEAATPQDRAVLLRGDLKNSFSTVQAAVDAAQPGDVIRVHPGTYSETVRIVGKQGTADQPITLEAKSGTVVLDGADPGLQIVPNQRWKPTEDGAWESVVPWAGPLERAQVTPVSPEEGPLLAAYHLPQKFSELSRGAGTLRDGTRLRIRFPDGKDPNAESLSVGISEAVVLFEDAEHWVLRGLELRHGGNAAVAIKGKSSNISLEGLTCRGSWCGIATEPGPNGNHDIRVLDCHVANRMNPAWHWTEGYEDVGDKKNEFEAPVRGTGILVEADQVEIRGNTVSGFWDGMAVRGVDIDIAENTISDIHDDGIELECGRSANVRFRDNRISNAFVGISLVSQQPGPVYIYRNRVSANREDPMDAKGPKFRRYGYCLKMGVDWGPGAQNVAIYQNTFYAKRLVLWDKEMAVWKDFRFVNNIFVSDGMKNDAGEEEAYMIWNTGMKKNGVLWNGNLYHQTRPGGILFRKWNGAADVKTLAAARQLCLGWEAAGREADPEFSTFDSGRGASNEFALSPSSPAINAGVQLLSDWPDSVRVTDGKPDIGAVESDVQHKGASNEWP